MDVNKIQEIKELLGEQTLPTEGVYFEELKCAIYVAREKLDKIANKTGGYIDTGDLDLFVVLPYLLGRIHGIRQERQRKDVNIKQLTAQELELLKGFRVAKEGDRKFLLSMARIYLEHYWKLLQIKEEAASAATPTA